MKIKLSEKAKKLKIKLKGKSNIKDKIRKMYPEKIS